MISLISIVKWTDLSHVLTNWTEISFFCMGQQDLKWIIHLMNQDAIIKFDNLNRIKYYESTVYPGCRDG